MKMTSRILIGAKASSQLGAAQVGQYGLYQLGLRTGHYRRTLDAALSYLQSLDRPEYYQLHSCLVLPDPNTIRDLIGDQITILYEQADEIVDGKVRLFGSRPVPLILDPPQPLEYWTKYEGKTGRLGGQDIKFIWEPARFGWACTLAMAYHLTQKEQYRHAFWMYTQQFLAANPPYMGPHWCSAQEVAIRMVALAFSLQVFGQPGQASAEQLGTLATSIAIHAGRIPPTMVYSRSQNNNHLITEALGLYTASAILPNHPLAPKWHRLGWKWLLHAFHTQIQLDGTYTQHSTNYHRLMIQAALWMGTLHDTAFPADAIPPEIETRLAQATRWLWQLQDPLSGGVPNLGHNDGAYILPLTVYPYSDYRPVTHAALKLFWPTSLDTKAPWDDMSHWLGISSLHARSNYDQDTYPEIFARDEISRKPPYVLTNKVGESWALIQAARFHSRPAHADQLHLDLWWHGINLALDPGTYLYNAPSPWENALTSAFVHNTVTVDGLEFMQRAGRFLLFDWAQSKVLEDHPEVRGRPRTLAASHNGYRRLGIYHTRNVTPLQDGNWNIQDCLVGPPGVVHTARLHWLLPDWDYEVQDMSQDEDFPGFGVILRSRQCKFTLRAGFAQYGGKGNTPGGIDFKLARAGELLVGGGPANPIYGWYSPTYGVKIPALAYILEVKSALPITLKSIWSLPRARAAVIIIKDGKVALIERHRAGKHYFVFAGGKIEPGETPQMAAARETMEELGLEVRIDRLVANIWLMGRPQYFYLAEVTGGVLGQGTDPQMKSLPGSQRGTYQPVWMPVGELPGQPVLPEQIADLVVKSLRTGWPEKPLVITELPSDVVV